MKRSFSYFLATVAFLLSIFIVQLTVSAAPYYGEELEIKQWDNSLIKVKVYGDEFYQRIESIDGYTLVRDPSTMWICYAKLNSDGSDFVSTGIPYMGTTKNPTVPAEIKKMKLQKGIKLKSEHIARKVKKAKDDIKWDEFLKNQVPKLETTTTTALTPSSPAQFAPAAITRSVTGITAQTASVTPVRVLQGSIKGLTILIDFPVEDANGNIIGDKTIPRSEIEAAFNQMGYSNNGNNGSVREYFYDISGGLVDYTNIVTDYYTAKYPREYYDDPTDRNGQKAKELIREALEYFEGKGYDFSTLTKSSTTNSVLCLNVLYSGSCLNGWKEGLWPHKGSISDYICENVTFSNYQITDLKQTFTIGTTVHENGHMLCGWADTYDHGNESSGCGGYDLMSSSGTTNPPLPNPYFRNVLCGWGNLNKLNTYVVPTQISVPANSIDTYIYETNKPNEFFMIENMQRSGRRTGAPDEGLLIWHIDKFGSNKYEDMTADRHYMVSVEQADGLYQLETERGNIGGDGDLFHAGGVDSFTPYTTVNSNLWDGTKSNLFITDISDIGSTMTFTYVPKLATPANLRLSERTGDRVTLMWDAVPGADHYYVYAYVKTATYSRYVDVGYPLDASFSYNLPDDSNFTFYVKAMYGNNSQTASEPSNPLLLSSDKTIPSSPGNLRYSNVTANSVLLSWDASSDNIEVKGYKIYNGMTLVGTTTETSFNVTDLSIGSTYNFSVAAYDFNDNTAFSDMISAYIKLAAPNLKLGMRSGMTVTLKWNAVNGADHYYIYADIKTGPYTRRFDIATPTDTSYTLNLYTDCLYTFYVIALSNAYPDVASDPSNPLFISADITPPTAPTNLTYSNVTSTTVDLTWDASSDNLGVTRYSVSYGDTTIDTASTSTSYRVTGLTPGTTYTFTVRAHDTNSLSESSSPVTVTTLQ